MTFDPEFGTGFVGKGDVQNAFGWNNNLLQRNASGVGFKYLATDEYDAVCTWTTGTPPHEQTHHVSHTETAALNSTIAYDPRVRSQITGFNLNGPSGEPTVTGEVPEVGQACQGQGTDGTWSSVTLVSSSDALYVTYNGNQVLIWQQ